MVMEGDLTWGGEHTVQYADDVLQNCTSDNLYNFISQCHFNKYNKKKFWAKKAPKINMSRKRNGEIIVSSIKGVGKTGYLHTKE